MTEKRGSYAQQVNRVRLLIEGIGKHLEDLSKLGLDGAYVEELKEQKRVVEEIDAQQERLKADLKSCTHLLSEEMKKMRRLANRGRKLVKIEIPQSQWKEFGIDAKK
jgi:hypothetical protein